jgi:hypothetical protein
MLFALGVIVGLAGVVALSMSAKGAEQPPLVMSGGIACSTEQDALAVFQAMRFLSQHNAIKVFDEKFITGVCAPIPRDSSYHVHEVLRAGDRAVLDGLPPMMVREVTVSMIVDGVYTDARFEGVWVVVATPLEEAFSIPGDTI